MSTNAPVVHSVHIYDTHTALIGRLCGIVVSGLNIGNAVLIIATPEHRAQLVEELGAAGVDVRGNAREGRFTMYDTQEMLSTFMDRKNGMPDRERFMAMISKLIGQAKKSPAGKERDLTVFGEMVAVLWDEGKDEATQKAALQLEALWNEALNDRAFHLHCAYPRAGFDSDRDRLGIGAVCRAHSHVVQ